MGVTRVQAIGPGAVEYLLKGCDPAHPEPGVDLEAGEEREAEGPEAEREPGGIGYFLEGHGEPTGVWLGSGMEGLGLSMRAGDLAREEDLRALFGELRYPNSERENSTEAHPIYLGAKPRAYQTLAERVDAALKAEPSATEERRREIEVNVARNTHSNTAYYDVTFSPVKSVSVYYAALVAAGEYEKAQQVRHAHDQAVRIGLESIENDVAWARTGRHGRASGSGRTTGTWEKGTGLSAVLFAHHTNRDGEPQLHAHVGVLNRIGLGDGRVYALDGKAFAPIKDAMTAAYDRALEAILTDLAGVTWVDRVDGLGREIAGIDPELIEEASSRSRLFVEPRIEELVAAYRERHGYDPGPQARRKIVDQAVKDTRRPKEGPAGPAAVAAWVERDHERRERFAAALGEVGAAVSRAAEAGWEPVATGYVVGQQVVSPGRELATGHERVASAGGGVASGQQPLAIERGGVASGQQPGGHGSGPVATAEQLAARGELAARAVAEGLAGVQARYPSWRLGTLVLEIDRKLGPNANLVGLGITDRHAWVRGLAEAAVAPGSGAGVVQVSMGDPVPVPDELRREVDGRSRFRAPIDERYATAEHLAVEQRLVATAQAEAATSLPAEVVGRVAEAATRDGFSVDQVAALSAILSSPRQVEVLVGPAGAGKSHTMGRLAQVWTAAHGGRAIGTATAEVATRNLAETGLDAYNIRKLVTKLTPDEQGRVRLQLTERDLLVIDEAGMVDTPDLDELMGFAVAAGAKVVWAGDHRQLPAVGAGGVFAYLAERPGAVELEQVFRFRAEWEREASLKLRAGDPSAAVAYADEGRLRAGTREQMEYLATRDYLADRLEGVHSLLIVGSNNRASQLSNDIQAQLAKLGLLGGHDLATLKDGNKLRMGDKILTREGSRSIRVEGGVDEHGRRREALPVANREVYTVVAYDPSTGTVFARDERGAVAHLPEEYVATQVTLAYAVTNHAAQGVTVQRGRPLAERGTSLEEFYPQYTRGWEYNVAYLETDIDPDPHHPQRERDTAISALARIIENEAGVLSDAALEVLESAEAEARSMLTLAEHYDRVAAGDTHSRHAALAIERLGAPAEQEAGFPALLGRMRAMEIAGHDITAMFDEAMAMSRLADARELSKVLHWRLGVLGEQRTPEAPREQLDGARRSMRPAWEQLAEQHRARAAESGSALQGYLATVAERAHERTRELGAQVAAEQPGWAREWLGALPDPQAQPDEHAAWVRDAGQVAAYREWRGIPDDQVSIGQAPPEAQQLAHELWIRAATAGAGDPRAVDWRTASDHELREAVAVWERAQQWAPPQVSPDRAEALALAHDAANDATLGRTRLARMAPDDPGREPLEMWVQTCEVMAEQVAGFASGLDHTRDARQHWWEQTREQREAAAGAEAELARRGLTRDDEPIPEHGAPEQAGPEPMAAEPQPEPQQEPADGAALAAAEPGQAAGPKPEQQALDLDLGRDEGGRGKDSPATPNRHERFLAGIAAEHQRMLDEVDPDQQLAPQAREAAARARNFERFIDDLRAEQGDRLDPQGQLGDLDLAHTRARELAATHGHEPTPEPTTPERAPTERPMPEATAPEATAPEATAPERVVPEPSAPEAERVVPEPTAPEPTTVERDVPADAPAPERAPDRTDTVIPEREQPTHHGLERDSEPTREERGDGLAELRRVAREDRSARITREARQRQAGPAEAQPEPKDKARELAAELDREATLDDELHAHRAPQREAEREREQQLERDEGIERD